MGGPDIPKAGRKSRGRLDRSERPVLGWGKKETFVVGVGAGSVLLALKNPLPPVRGVGCEEEEEERGGVGGNCCEGCVAAAAGRKVDEDN